MIDRERIKERAYSLWETEGNPDGCHAEHWVRAEQEIDVEDMQSPAPDAPLPVMFSAAIALPDRSTASCEALTLTDACYSHGLYWIIDGALRNARK
ncbi:DUF2934 domain-containing protein [Pararhizobium sp. DWP3-4]|uniref:DUF2934 domain-containing protein n=1 Tax=unclassified Pararhizobium TaxID=2643050 RepID=UPI003CFA2D9C